MDESTEGPPRLVETARSQGRVLKQIGSRWGAKAVRFREDYAGLGHGERGLMRVSAECLPLQICGEVFRNAEMMCHEAR
jgi:hypothetical protein